MTATTTRALGTAGTSMTGATGIGEGDLKDEGDE
jgi:hypothetical protein